MAAELLDNLFFADRAEPAWHGVMKAGIDPTRRYTAREVLDVLGGPSYMKLPLQTIAQRQDGTHITVPAYAIVRTPYGDNKTDATMGIVREGYNLVTPEQVVQMWDDRTGKHVETAAFLREGKLFLLTARLEPIDVVGDTVQMYLGLHTWMDGLTASTALTSGVREVCMNTVQMAHQAAKQMVKFNHDRWILDRMGRWMADVIDQAEHGLPALAEAMRALADYRLQSPKAEVVHVLTAAYPTPPRPEADPTWSKEYTELRNKKWDQEARLITDRRQAALDLFKGRGTGMDSKAAAGTAWGLYNAVVEVEDWRGGARANDADARAAAILVGERAEAKARAWTAAVQVAKGELALV
jgi:hypothetical protein